MNRALPHFQFFAEGSDRGAMLKTADCVKNAQGFGQRFDGIFRRDFAGSGFFYGEQRLARIRNYELDSRTLDHISNQPSKV